MEILIVAILLGLITGKIASVKGRSFFWFWLYGALLFIVAIVHVLIMRNRAVQQCPKCAENVKKEAKVCKHCDHSLEHSQRLEAR